MPKIDEISQVIAALEAQRPVLGDSVVDAALAPLREKLAELEQQDSNRRRRLVTVLFLDIVNSTLLSQGLEPEEVQEVMGGALKRLSAPVDAHGGKVIQFMGDGFEAVFGLDKVQEDDARNAVRAGLQVLDEARACVQDLETRYRLRGFDVRVGINTGRVVPGQFSEGESQIMGLTVSLAARMEQSAQAGTVLISEFTHQHIRGSFELEALPPVHAKGFPQPVMAYRVKNALPRTFRTFTRGVEGIHTDLIGRETELNQLRKAHSESAQDRHASLVTITGDAGVGKSRLLYEFDRWLAKQPRTDVAFKGRASSEHTSLPFGLLKEMLSFHLGLAATDSTMLTREKLVAGLSAHLGDEAVMKTHFIGSLLGFDFSESPYIESAKNDPAQLRERGQLYLLQYMEAISNSATVLLLLDDIHWADLASLSFIDRLVRLRPEIPMLILCLTRPVLTERFPAWGKTTSDDPLLPPLRHGISLNLEPLSQKSSQKLLDEILCNVESFPESVRVKILESAGGNPFYIEEYVQTLVDNGIVHRPKRSGPWTMNLEKLDRLEMPATLEALLEARLDSLTGPQRVLIQQAAVIGRVFWRSALDAMQDEKAASEIHLKALEAHGFIFRQETSIFEGSEEYRFHHGLLRDAAYGLLLKSDRQKYHAKAAEWLAATTQAGGRSGEFSLAIAQHFEAAGESLQAADWFIQSGTRARDQGEPSQARLFFNRALSLLPEDDSRRRWKAIAGRDEVLNFLGDTAARITDDENLVALAEALDDDSLRSEAYYRKGYTLGMMGRYAEEREAYLLAMKAARRANDMEREVLILGLKVVCEVRLGDLAAAARTAEEALRRDALLAEEYVTARTLINVSTYFTEVGDLARSLHLLERQLEIMHRTGNLEGESAGLINYGYTCILLGRTPEAINSLKHGIETAQAISHRSFAAYCRLNLALALLRNDESRTALSELELCRPEFEAMNDAFGAAISQEYEALALEQAGLYDQALTGFKKVAESLQNIKAASSLRDALAGTARAYLALNNKGKALQIAEALWSDLHQQPGAGMEFPILGYETCADVFLACGRAEQAREVLASGCQELKARAEKISMPEWRASFLGKVPEHRRLLARCTGFDLES